MKNYDKAFDFLNKASDLGSVSSKFALANMYLWGMGVKESEDEYIKLLIEVSDDFDKEYSKEASYILYSEYNSRLSLMVENEVIDEDQKKNKNFIIYEEEANKFLNRAAIQGHQEAKIIIANKKHKNVIKFPYNKKEKNRRLKLVEDGIKIRKNRANQIEKILKRENKFIEFKETFFTSTSTEIRKNNTKTVKFSALKTITAFLNTDGGTLFIGIKDAKNTKSGENEVVGIDKDDFKTKDQYVTRIAQTGFNALDIIFAKHVNINLFEYENKTICEIKCEKAKSPAYLKGTHFDEDDNTNNGKKDDGKNAEIPYIRYDSNSIQPTYKSWVQWVNDYF